MDTITGTFDWWVDNADRLASAVETHIELTVVSLSIATAIALLLGFLAASAGRVLGFAVVQLANLGRIVPSLAILALALPLVGVGFWPSIIALVAVGVPPILVNTHAALTSTDRALLDAAAGVGMTRTQIVRRVRTPLGMPLVVAGIRTSAVQIVATATLAALIGGGGLGEIVFNGIAVVDNTIILAGVIPIAVLALLVEGGFALLERRVTPRGLRFV